MSSLASLVGTDGPLKMGSDGADVIVLQQALSAAGYRVEDDGIFGQGTESAVRRFQAQHGLPSDGIVGPGTAGKLDEPHADLVAAAQPMVHTNGWPHDDTASLIAFYGKPWENSALLGRVTPPFQMIYTDDDGRVTPIHSFEMHSKLVVAVTQALQSIWELYNKDQGQIEATGLHNFGGSYNYRPIRGSSRLSCHSFGAAVDIDPVHNPLIYPGHPNQFKMPSAAVGAFKATGAFWGDDYHGRKDPMHYQWAKEG